MQENFITKVTVYLKAGNYNGAIGNYDKALAIEKDYRIYYQKGVAQKKV